MYADFMFRRNMNPSLPTTAPLPVFFSSKKWHYRWKCQVGLAEVDEGGDDGDQARHQVHQLDVVEVEESAQEVARRDAEPALDVCEEDDSFASALRRELLARCRPPADPRLGPQQPAVRQRLDLVLYHYGHLPDGARIWVRSLLHLFFFKAGALGYESHKRLGSHARSRRRQT
jgi:hypothetical protein